MKNLALPKRFFSRWRTACSDRMMQWRELAADQDRRRRRQSHLQLLALESRITPALVGLDDSNFFYVTAGFANVPFDENTYAKIQWGDGTPDTVVPNSQLTVSGNPPFTVIGVGAVHDYDLISDEWGGPYQVVTTLYAPEGPYVYEHEQGVAEGQHVHIEYVPPENTTLGADPQTPLPEDYGNPTKAKFKVWVTFDPQYPFTKTISVDWKTRDGALDIDPAQWALIAPPGGDHQDYFANQGTLTFTPANPVQYVEVEISNDDWNDMAEAEVFSVVLSQPVQANREFSEQIDFAAGKRFASCWIGDVDPIYVEFDRKQFAERKVKYLEIDGEGKVQTKTLEKVRLASTLEISPEFKAKVVLADETGLPRRSERTLEIGYHTRNATEQKLAQEPYAATPNADYVEIPGPPTDQKITFAPGDKSKTFSVNIIADNKLEPSEYFGLELTTDTKVAIPDQNMVDGIGKWNPVNVRIIDVTLIPIFGGFISVGGLFAPTSQIGSLAWYAAVAGMNGLFDADPSDGALVGEIEFLECGNGATCIRKVSKEKAKSFLSYAKQALTFVSRWATGDAARPLVQQALTFAESIDPRPFEVTTSLVFGANASAPVTFSVPNSTDPLAFSLRPDAPITQPGVYNWTMNFTAKFDVDGEVLEGTYSHQGRTAVPLRSDAMFGQGWDQANYDRLVVDKAGAWIMYDYGDGTAQIFDKTGTNTYTSPEDFGSISYQSGEYVYTDLDGTVKRFRASDGKLSTITDRHNQTITYTYDSQSRLINITDPDGRVAYYSYNGTSPRVSKLEQAGNRIFTFEYNANEMLEKVHMPDAGTILMAYDSVGRLASYQWGPLWGQYKYDPDTGVVRSLDQGGGTVVTYNHSAEVGFGKAGQPNALVPLSQVMATVTDPVGGITTYKTDLTGRGLIETSPDQSVRTWSFDERARLVTFTDPVGTTTYDYLPDTNLVSKLTRPDGSYIQFKYDPAKYYQLTEYTDSLGHVTLITLNNQGDPATITDAEGKTSIFDYQNGFLQSFTDARSYTTQYKYDLNNRLDRIIDPYGKYVSFGYDAAWNLVSVIDPLGHETKYKYNGMRRLIETTDAAGAKTSYEYNDPGWLTKVTDPLGRVTTLDYNDPVTKVARGWVYTITEAVGTSLQRSLTFDYDKAGRRTKATDALGFSTLFDYDPVGRIAKVTDAEGGLTQFKYDLAGRVIEITDAEGRATTGKYEEWGNLVMIIDPENGAGAPTVMKLDSEGNVSYTIDPRGTITEFTYDNLNRLTIVYQASNTSDARTMSYKYDEVGNVIEYTDPLYRTTTFGYDKLNRNTQIIDPLSRVIQLGYDDASRLETVTGHRGTVTRYGYDPVGRTIKITEADNFVALKRTSEAHYNLLGQTDWTIDPRGTKSEFNYDELNRLTKITEAVNEPSLTRSTQYKYDLGDRLIQITDPRGTVTVIAPDKLGRTLSITEAYGDATFARTTSYKYDKVGNVTQVTDPIGTQTSLAYDKLNRLITITEAANVPALTRSTNLKYDPNGNPIRITDALGTMTDLVYDSLNRLTTLVEAVGIVNLERSTSWQYNAADELTMVTDPRGTQTTYFYDPIGRPTSVTEAANIPGLARTTYYTYDPVDDLYVDVTNPRGFTGRITFDRLNRVASQTDPLGHGPSYGYDANDNLISVTDALGKITTQKFDELNRVIELKDPLNHATSYGYDANNNVVTVTDANGNTTSFTYDPLNRLSKRTDPRGGITTLNFDSRDNLTKITDPVNNKTSFVYDQLNRRTKLTDQTGQSVLYTFDKLDRLTSEVDRSSRTRNYTYNALNQLTGETWITPGLGTVNTVVYKYDANDNQTYASNKNGMYTLKVNELNQVTEVQGFWGTKLTFTYDPAGNRDTVTDNFGGVQISVHDEANRLTSRTFDSPTLPELRIDYGYTDRDELKSIKRYTDLAGTQLAASTDFKYDDAGRIESIDHKDKNSTSFLKLDYQYDPGNRITSLTRDGVTTTFAYDKTDQLTAEGAKVWGYDLNGNRTDFTYTSENQISGGYNTVYQYDANGNLILTRPPKLQSGEMWKFGYDHRNQLVWVERWQRYADIEQNKDQPAGSVAGDVLIFRIDYKYDAWGNRVEGRKQDYNAQGQVTSDVTERYAVDGWDTKQDFWGNSPSFVGNENFDVWADLNASNQLTVRRVYGDGVDDIAARVDANGVKFYHADHLGSIVGVTDGNTLTQSETSYDAWGQLKSGTLVDRYGYTGREWDTAAELYHYRAREYDPFFGRFLQEDPLGYAAGDTNLYRYVGNGVMGRRDPSGLDYILVEGDTVYWVIEDYGRIKNSEIKRLPIGKKQFDGTVKIFGNYGGGVVDLADLEKKAADIFYGTPSLAANSSEQQLYFLRLFISSAVASKRLRDKALLDQQAFEAQIDRFVASLGCVSLGSLGTYWGQSYSEAGQLAADTIRAMAVHVGTQVALQLAAQYGLPFLAAFTREIAAKGWKLAKDATGRVIGVVDNLGRTITQTEVAQLIKKLADSEKIVAQLVAQAEKLHPKLAGKKQWHHTWPFEFGPPPDMFWKHWPRIVELPAAYHQLITNELRSGLKAFGSNPTQAELWDLLRRVYDKYPIDRFPACGAGHW